MRYYNNCIIDRYSYFVANRDREVPHSFPPSHTTRHRGPYHGGSIWLNAVMSVEANQPHSIKELVVECHLHAWNVTHSPRAFRTERRGVSQLRFDPTLDQFRLSSAINLPVFPLETTQTTANPAVQVSQHLRRLAKAKIAPPPSQIRG